MNIAILLAAGKSTRAGQNKLWTKILGKELWTLSYETLCSHPEVDQIILVVPAGDEEKFKPYLKTKTKICSGGDTRSASFWNAMDLLELKDDDLILDHNAANPFVSTEEISAVLKAAQQYGAAALSQPAVDTILEMENGFYTKALDRSKLRLMQTPQAVQVRLLKSLPRDEATDLSSLLLKIIPVKAIDASPLNKKITFAEDLQRLSGFTYLGEDSHAFSNSGTLKLGGLNVPDLPALEANSDGDVILHAIGRALAQAKNTSFSKIADALCEQGEKESAVYLQPFLEDLTILQVSLQIEAARPRIDELPLQESLAKILKITPDKIRISAMSGEGLSSFGKGEGIRVLSLVTVL